MLIDDQREFEKRMAATRSMSSVSAIMWMTVIPGVVLLLAGLLAGGLYGWLRTGFLMGFDNYEEAQRRAEEKNNAL